MTVHASAEQVNDRAEPGRPHHGERSGSEAHKRGNRCRNQRHYRDDGDGVPNRVGHLAPSRLIDRLPAVLNRSLYPAPVLPWVAILCGGKGTRMRAGEETVPKPLVEIGGRPVLWHVMSLYSRQGFDRFLLLTGNSHGAVEGFADTLDWDVTCLETGADTPTGGRVQRARRLLAGGTFCLTYPGRVAAIHLRAVLE